MPVDGVRLREVPAESLLSTTFDAQLDLFYNSLRPAAFSPRLISQVWSASRCVQLNAQQIAAMPMRFFGPPSVSDPAWVSAPDDNWFPNGIADAVFAAVDNLYRWGDAFLHITSRYATGFPSGWTVLDSEAMHVQRQDGRRVYKYGQQPLNADDVVQISRNPCAGAVRGTPALSPFGSQMLSAISSSDLTRTLNESGSPQSVLKSKRKLTKDQAEALQAQWVARTAARRGVPAVLPPEVEFEKLGFTPAELELVDVQQFDARVIASAFGVPPFMLNVPLDGGLTYQNPAMLFEVWWRTELRPTSKLVANALTANMLPRGSWVEFDARDLLAPDFKTDVDAWKVLVTDMQIATKDEARAAVLRRPPQSEQENVLDELTNPNAAVPATQPDTSAAGDNVQPIRPPQQVNA